MAHLIPLPAISSGVPVRAGWLPGSITPGPMGLGPRHRVPIAPAAMSMDAVPPVRSQMPDGAAAYAAALALAAGVHHVDAHPVGAEPDDVVVAPPVPRESVAQGLALSALVIPVGMIVAGVIGQLGYLASVAGLIVVVGALALYTKGAGAAPRRGVAPLLLLIVVGVVASFLAGLVLDLNTIYLAAAALFLASGALVVGLARSARAA